MIFFNRELFITAKFPELQYYLKFVPSFEHNAFATLNSFVLAYIPVEIIRFSRQTKLHNTGNSLANTLTRTLEVIFKKDKQNIIYYLL